MTATISLVAGSQPDGLIAAAARLGASIASLEAQISAQRDALAQLTSGLAKSATDFHLPSDGHVYVGAASSDPVTHFGGMQIPITPFPPSPFDVPAPGIPVGLGTDPAVDGFGSTRFKAEVPGLDFPFSDHSKYFTPGGESLYAIADITSGNGAMLSDHDMTARHSGEYLLADWVDPELLRTPISGHYH